MKIPTEIEQAVDRSEYADRANEVLAYSDPYSRSSSKGHITASGLVLDGSKVLLIFHPYIKKWFQPGGHIDEGEMPIEAAIREVYEETGYVCELDAEDLSPIDIDIHEIPENSKKGEGAHIHIDLLYHLKVLHQVKSDEDIVYEWVEFDQIQSARIKRALAKLS
jgi:8-oxo-dGTP pyrophosphatase MutT (NUDIX family)